MAAATTIIAGASAGLGLFQTAKGISDANQAKKAIEGFDRQDLENPYKNIQVSTLASEQQTEANLSGVATSVDALQRAGTRAVLGGIPRINQQNILLQNMISADLDKQDKERQQLIAQGEENIRAIRENRETRALAGLGQQLQTARQDTMSGLTNALSSGLAMASSIDANKNEAPLTFKGTGKALPVRDFNPYEKTVSQINQSGVVGQTGLEDVALPNLSGIDFSS